MDVRKQVLLVSSQIITIPGGRVAGLVGVGELHNKANSVHLQLQLPTGTELGKKSR